MTGKALTERNFKVTDLKHLFSEEKIREILRAIALEMEQEIRISKMYKQPQEPFEMR